MNTLIKYSLIFVFLGLSVQARENSRRNLYDPDSLVVVALLDSNNYSHDFFWVVTWALTKETVPDTSWRIAELYLNPWELPHKLKCLPPEIGNLPRMLLLRLAGNALESIPKEINKIAMFQLLDLRYNPLKEIPVEISRCSMLSYLGLSNTRIISLPDEFLDLDLRPCNIAVDTINGNIYPRGVIDLCGLENFVLTERQKVWAGVSDYAEYEAKYCRKDGGTSGSIVTHEKRSPGFFAEVRGQAAYLTLEREGAVSLSLYTVSGKHIAALVRGKRLSGGRHLFPLKENISPGIYFFRGEVDNIGFTGKIAVGSDMRK